MQILDSSSYSENFMEIELKILKLSSFKDFIAVFFRTRKCGVWVVFLNSVTYAKYPVAYVHHYLYVNLPRTM